MIATATSGPSPSWLLALRRRAAAFEAVVPAALLLAAVSFNAVLAFVNANLVPLTPAPVIAAEVLIAGGGFLWGALHYRQEMDPWLALIAFGAFFAVLRMSALGDFEPKNFRDFMLAPTFVLIGMTCPPRRLVQAVAIMQGAVLVGVLLEALAPGAYADLFRVKDFYISTRGMSFDEFTNEASSLYVSATRPEARFLPFFDLHRLSSIFLEPVSLGNFAIVITAFVVAMWRNLSSGERAFFIGANLLTLFASDGRLALAVSLFIILAASGMRRLPPVTPLIVAPLAVLLAILWVVLGDIDSAGDNLTGRVSYTVRLLGEMDVIDWFGMSDRLVDASVDSGLVYLIVTQSVFGLCLFYSAVALSEQRSGAEFQTYRVAMCMFLAATMLVSNAFVGIKSAAPAWFIFGALAVAPLALQRRGAE